MVYDLYRKDVMGNSSESDNVIVMVEVEGTSKKVFFRFVSIATKLKT